MKFSKKQKFSYRNSKKRINLWEGSIRSGKSWIIDARWLKYVAKEAPQDGDLMMIGKTNETLYRNVIKPIQDMVGLDNSNYNIGRRMFNLWGRDIHCFGANDERAEEKIRGMTSAGCLGDEVSLWPENMIVESLGRMSLKGAQFFGSTNPDNPKHYLKTNYIDRIGEDDLDMAVFHFMLEDNHTLDPAYIRNVKKEYKGVWYKRKILGLWVLAEGAIYDFFDEKAHLIRYDQRPTAKWHYASIDYGTHNPFSCGIYGVDPNGTPKVWREQGYYYDSKEHQAQKTDEQYITDLETWWSEIGIRPREIFVDPSAASLKTALTQAGYWVKDANNDVSNGIECQARMLVNGSYRITDHPSNQPCIDEYYGYCWDPRKALIGEDAPIKERDHCKDDERYGLYTQFGEDLLDYSVLTKT